MTEKTLHVDLRVGQTMTVGGARISLEEKSGQRARLRITAPPSLTVEVPTRRTSDASIARRGILRLKQPLQPI